MTDKELKKAMEDLKEIRIMIGELEAEADALKDSVKAAMITRGTDVLTVGAFKATWKAVTTRRFDSKRFKADHADIYGLYTKETTTRRFSIQ